MARKPDFENESFRAWVADKNDQKQYSRNDNRIRYRGYTFVLQGFTVVKEKGRVVLAFKFKHESRMLMVFFDERNERLKGTYAFLRKSAEWMGYGIVDVKEAFDRILLEEKTMRKLAKKPESSGEDLQEGE